MQSLRGEIDGGLASELHARARPARREHCEISSVGNYAQVSWGKAFGGNDARHKVIFERVNGGQWVEILRYEAPTPTPARSRNTPREINVRCGRGVRIRRLAGASADSTS